MSLSSHKNEEEEEEYKWKMEDARLTVNCDCPVTRLEGDREFTWKMERQSNIKRRLKQVI